MYFVVTNWLNYSLLDRSSPIFMSHSSPSWFRSALKPFHRFPMRFTESTSRQTRSINYRSGQWSRGGSAPSGHCANHRPLWPSDPSDCSRQSSCRVIALRIRQGQGQGQPICSKSVFRFPTSWASPLTFLLLPLSTGHYPDLYNNFRVSFPCELSFIIFLGEKRREVCVPGDI